MRRVNLNKRDDDQGGVSNEMEEDLTVLHVDGSGGNQPFVMKGKINDEPFTAMIDSGRPITNFTKYKNY